MEDVSFSTLGAEQGDVGALLDDASKFVKNRNASEAKSCGGHEVSAFASLGLTTCCSEFYSMQIATSMRDSRSELETELELQTAHSKVHWSELSDPEEASDSESLGVDHRQYFEKLQKDAHWGRFCSEVTNVVLGEKLGEGSQASIYEAQVTFARNEQTLCVKCPTYVVKLMKADCALEDLQRQWPHGLGHLDFEDFLLHLRGALVKEPTTGKNTFGFVMPRFYNDLRSLINLRMERKNGGGPPFSLPQTKHLIHWIARDMTYLHKKGIIHRDLKASNVLVKHYMEDYDIESSNHQQLIVPWVADWECSIGVGGTGWWRAPEILLQLKNRILSSKLEYDEKVDVYSFAMTCYEIATGLVPFEGQRHSRKLCDDVLDGVRPRLPLHLDPAIKAMITSCWDPNPLLRPSFGKLKAIYQTFRFGV